MVEHPQAVTLALTSRREARQSDSNTPRRSLLREESGGVSLSVNPGLQRLAGQPGDP